MSKLDDITLEFIGGIAAATSTTPIEGLKQPNLETVRKYYKQRTINLILEMINGCVYDGELNSDSSARRHPHGIIDPEQIRKDVQAL